MMILVIGGSGSGKSSYAEEIVCSVSGEDMKKYYLATMQIFDEDGERRLRGIGNSEVEKVFLPLSSLQK